ncbi:MAG: GNAT family N-acetyltransferase [Myxococcota bacterium]|nr:GNAT family N-acetyltransferase [Myxococcota bacterium]
MTGKIREAGDRDLDRVAALWTAITVFHEPLDPVFRMRRDAEGEIKGLLRAMGRDPDAAILVYEAEGNLLGLCIVRIDHSPPIMEETRRAEITDLGVREDARRQGIGTRLLDHALEWVRASGVGRVEAQVASANPTAQAFWRAHGFTNFMDVLDKRL